MKSINNSNEINGDRIIAWINAFVLVLVSLAFILPFFIVVMTSFVSETEIAVRGGFILIPNDFDLSAYKILFSKGTTIYRAYGNTILRVVVATGLQILFTSSFAYAISKDYLPGSRIAITIVTIAMVFPVGLIPQFLLVKKLGLIDSFWSLSFPFLINSYNLFIMKAFFKQLPIALEESAVIDGCNELQVFTKIILPLSLPSIATVGLFYAVFNWNEWFYSSIFINSTEKLPMQNILQSILLRASSMDLNSQMSESAFSAPLESLKSAMIVVTTLPILMVYPFIQKYFVKGLTVGAVKG